MFNVLVDTREKNPWDIAKSSQIDKVIPQKLDTGDYTIEGLGHMLCIERKSSVSEIANNIAAARWKACLDRMRVFPFRYIICEFTYQDILSFPYKRFNMRANPKWIMKMLSHYQVEYGINVVMAGDADIARWVAVNVMKEVAEKYGRMGHN